MKDHAMGYSPVYRKVEYSAWSKWFAWYPVIVNNKRKWLTTVYRRQKVAWIDLDSRKSFQYGTFFDAFSE